MTVPAAPREELAGDPLAVLGRWVAEAAAAALPAPGAMVLATGGAHGPRARTVVVTQVDDEGLRFHSSSPTRKTDDLRADPRACGVLHWPALGRQAVVTGVARELPAEVSRAAYPTRPRQLQLLAWAYEDLAPGLPVTAGAVPAGVVEERFAAAAERDPGTLPMPEGWTTFTLVPERVDFWQGGDDAVPPGKTCFVRDGDGPWERFTGLP